MRKDVSSELTEKQASQVRKLASISDDEIDTSDIPEVLDWSGAKRGLLYRPTKQQITLRLDVTIRGAYSPEAIRDSRSVRSTACRTARNPRT